MRVIVIDLATPRRKLKDNLPAAYVVTLGVLAVKGWLSLWP
ncbi:hypothetical protein [Paenibacillus alkalitolerans]|nr:hypothetical protein [Paenibacillus alkalitolerans]